MCTLRAFDLAIDEGRRCSVTLDDVAEVAFGGLVIPDFLDPQCTCAKA
jgi:hypothetical protein